MTDAEIRIVNQGGRSLLVKVMAALCFTLALVLVFFIYVITFEFNFDLGKEKDFVKWSKDISSILVIGVFLAGLGITLMQRKRVFFNLQQKKYKIEYYVGPIYWGKWKSFSALKRVGIFKNTKGIFELNIWFTDKRHVKFEKFHDYKDALAEAHYVAKILELDILDASDPGNPVLLE